MIEMNFKSNYIRNFRDKYNLSQYELADLMNVNQSTIARWEKGEKTPSVVFIPIITAFIYLLAMIMDSIY